MTTRATVSISMAAGVLWLGLAGCSAPETRELRQGAEDELIARPGAAGSVSEMVSRAREDLARRLSVPAREIEVEKAEDVTWRDAGLGCPEPGMNYAQRLTPGVRIVLRADGEQYHYHAGGGRAPFLCENPQPPASARHP